MPLPVPLPVRRALLRRLKAGQSVARMADDLGLAPRTVRRLVSALRQHGPDALRPAYHTGAAGPPPPLRAVHQAALTLRQQHPGWGGGLIRVWLRRQGYQPLPARRTLQRWFRQAGLAPATAGRPKRDDAPRATVPHQTWQMDACEHLRLLQGEACWLRLTDEYTGAVLLTVVFPPGLLGQGARRGGAGGLAAGVRSLGQARTTAGGQWYAVGGHWGAADRTGPVAARLERAYAVEPTAPAPTQRGGRAFAGSGPALGRAAELRLGRGTAGAVGRVGRGAA